MRPRLPRRTRWLALLLVLAGFVAGASAGADSETFFVSTAPCPVAHCNQHLDGQEGVNTGTTQPIPVSTPPSGVTTFTPAIPIAFDKGLGCTAGMPGSGSYANAVECTGTVAGSPTPTATPTDTPCSGGSCLNTATPLPTSTPVPGPFVLNLQANTSGHATLTQNWTSAAYIGTPTLPCTAGSAFPVDSNVVQGAPLFSDAGYTYLSDDNSMVKYNPTGNSSGLGTCAWGKTNPAGAAMISWNAVHLPAYGSGATPYQGGYFLIGQGTAGPVLLQNFSGSTTVTQLALPDYNGGSGAYVTYNTLSAVEVTPSSGQPGVRVYDSTADCAVGSGCKALAQAPGRLYALDVLSPSSQSGTPTLQVAWYYDFEGPSGASPMVMPAEDQGTGHHSPVGDQVYFDGSGPKCSSSPCTQPKDPSLFALQDECPFGTQCCAPGPGATCGSSSSTWEPVWSSNPDPLDFAMGVPTQYRETGYCTQSNPVVYDGIQSAPVLEMPEVSGGTDTDYSVWEHVACGSWLYRIDAQSGALWTGGGVGHGGASSININGLSGLNNYVPGSTMQTVTDADLPRSGYEDQVAFLGVNESPPSKDSYVIALDLENTTPSTQLLWSIVGPDTVPDPSDSPFHGQFPIAQTGASSYMLIAPTAGSQDGATILGIPLK